MAENKAEVIKEFLIALGFDIDVPSARRFEEVVGKVNKTAAVTGGTIIGVAVALETMVKTFTSGMEKLGYVGMRTNSTTAGLTALAFAAEEVGAGGEQALAALESLYRGIRANPGKLGVLHMLGVDTSEGRKGTEVIMDLLDSLKDMPTYLQGMWGHELGIDPDTLFMLIENLPKLKEAQAHAAAAIAASGVDMEKAKEASAEYEKTIREVMLSLKLLRAQLSIQLLPKFQEFATEVNNLIDYFTKLNAATLDFDPKYLVGFLKEQISGWGAWGRAIVYVIEKLGMLGNVISNNPAVKGMTWIWKQLLGNADAAIQSKFGDPSAPAGAPAGPGGGARPDLIGGTDVAPYTQTGMGPGRSWKDKNGKWRYEGYDWRVPANVQADRDRRAREILGSERNDFPVDASLYDRALGDYGGAEKSIMLNQETNITVHGAGSPNETASAVGREQERVLGNTTRLFKQRVH